MEIIRIEKAGHKVRKASRRKVANEARGITSGTPAIRASI